MLPADRNLIILLCILILDQANGTRESFQFNSPLCRRVVIRFHFQPLHSQMRPVSILAEEAASAVGQQGSAGSSDELNSEIWAKSPASSAGHPLARSRVEHSCESKKWLLEFMLGFWKVERIIRVKVLCGWEVQCDWRSRGSLSTLNFFSTFALWFPGSHSPGKVGFNFKISLHREKVQLTVCCIYLCYTGFALNPKSRLLARETLQYLWERISFVCLSIFAHWSR